MDVDAAGGNPSSGTNPGALGAVRRDLAAGTYIAGWPARLACGEPSRRLSSESARCSAQLTVSHTGRSTVRWLPASRMRWLSYR